MSDVGVIVDVLNGIFGLLASFRRSPTVVMCVSFPRRYSSSGIGRPTNDIWYFCGSRNRDWEWMVGPLPKLPNL